jgi:hypothetical protein
MSLKIPSSPKTQSVTTSEDTKGTSRFQNLRNLITTVSMGALGLWSTSDSFHLDSTTSPFKTSSTTKNIITNTSNVHQLTSNKTQWGQHIGRAVMVKLKNQDPFIAVIKQISTPATKQAFTNAFNLRLTHMDTQSPGPWAVPEGYVQVQKGQKLLLVPSDSIQTNDQVPKKSVVLNTHSHPEIRNYFLKEAHTNKDFQAFQTGQFEVVSGSNMKYNCIAHSLGITNEWIFPKRDVADMDKLMEKYGYTALDVLDLSLQEGIQKVVVCGFASEVPNMSTNAHYPASDKYAEVRHAIKQEVDGTWTSKDGDGETMRTLSPNTMRKDNGVPIRVYVKATKI